MDTRTGLPVVGMVGGGQLARMTHQAAISLGQSLRVLAAAPDDGAALIAADVRLGDHTDLDTLRTFAKGCDVVTFDHEHVPGEHIRTLAAEGVTVHPSADALRYTQDKRLMRERLAGMGVPVPRWRPVASGADIAEFTAEVAAAGRAAQVAAGAGQAVRLGAGAERAAQVAAAAGQAARVEAAGQPAEGSPVVVKAVRGGYDGRGVWLPSSVDDAWSLVDSALASGTELIVEERVPLRRELAALVARSPFGQVAAYPVVETVQRAGICVEVLAPAPGLPEDLAVSAQRLAIRLASGLGVVGLLAVELFELDSGGLVVNELAMRPHNSGHWTIEGARTSQFEQHLRAVLDYPLGDTALAAPAVAMANVLGGEAGGRALDERLHHLFAADPGAKVHLYGKQVRPGRKIGHVTVLGDDMDRVRARAVRAARWLRDGTPAGAGTR
jgi:5-(carboxyamino)imidazole ribonucleotide synthase